MSFELSPSLVNVGSGEERADAYELKFHLSEERAAWVESWARERLIADPHGDAGRYLTTSLYCDTKALDVFHRSPGFKRLKFRLRRYGESDVVFLERKRRKGDVVKKRRDVVPEVEVPLLGTEDISLDWAGGWFYRQLKFRELRPRCRIAYMRTAFMGTSPTGTVRLTLDRDVQGVPTDEWGVARVEGGKVLLTGVVLELKFRATLPAIFRELLEQVPHSGGGVSKYRLCVNAWSLAGDKNGCCRSG